MNFNDKGYLQILTEQNNHYRVKDLTNSNLAKTLARLIIRAYSNDLERINLLTGTTLEEVQYGFNQLRGLLVDLEFVDPDKIDFIESRFRESNLFLPVSNGDDYANFEEIHHLILHIMSGIKRADNLYPLAMDKCLKLKNSIVHAKTEFNEDCLIDLYFNEEASFLDLPEFLKLKSDKNEKGDLKFTPEQNKIYYLSLLKAAGHNPNDNKTVYLRDAALFPHVVQYIEVLYSTHDTNRDGILDKAEALAAFPIFKNLIEQVVKKNKLIKPEFFPGVFVYLLKNGREPKTPSEKFSFIAFVSDIDCSEGKVCQKGWDIQSTRHDLGKIFNYIADSTKPVTPPPTTPPIPTPPAP